MTVLINASNTSGLTFSSDTSGSIAFQSQGSNVATIQPAGFSYPGGIVQVVNLVNSTFQSSSSSTYVDTGLSLSITPKFATSKILVMVNMNDVLKFTSDTYAGLRVLRNSTTITTFASGASYTQSSGTNTTGAGTTYLDSPATTSAVTYKVQFASLNNTGTVQINSGVTGTNSSSMTLMEVAV